MFFRWKCFFSASPRGSAFIFLRLSRSFSVSLSHSHWRHRYSDGNKSENKIDAQSLSHVTVTPCSQNVVYKNNKTCKMSGITKKKRSEIVCTMYSNKCKSCLRYGKNTAMKYPLQREKSNNLFNFQELNAEFARDIGDSVPKADANENTNIGMHIRVERIADPPRSHVHRARY